MLVGNVMDGYKSKLDMLKSMLQHISQNIFIAIIQ